MLVVKINNSKKIINCNYVICNSDPPNVYKNLIKSKKNYSFLFLSKNEKNELFYTWAFLFIILDQKKGNLKIAQYTIYFWQSYENI